MSGQARRGRAFPTPPGPRGSNGTEVPLGAAGHLSGYFWLFWNPRWPPFTTNTGEPYFLMKSGRFRWVFIVLALLAGIGLGLVYGWFVDPVDYFDITPDTLRADYKADYVLMIAEAYRVEQDPGLAARRLAVFGSQSPSSIAARGLEYARTSGIPDSDIVLLQELVTALQAWSGINP